MMQDKVYCFPCGRSRSKVRVELPSFLLFVIRRMRHFVVFSCIDFIEFFMVPLGIVKLVMMILMMHYDVEEDELSHYLNDLFKLNLAFSLSLATST